MRWLLLKDLQILRRSPLVSALLVIYPVAIAVLIGFALSGGPEEPRIAFLTQLPEVEQIDFGEQGEVDAVAAKDELCARVECVDVSSREEAEQAVEDGEVLGALVIPPDLIDKLESLQTLDPAEPTIEVLVNEEDPDQGQIVDDRIQALITEGNLLISQQVSDQAANYLDLLVEGGDFSFLGQTVEILGLERSGQVLEAIGRDLPRDERAEVERVVRFANLARENLDLALPLLGAVAQPIEVEKEVVE